MAERTRSKSATALSAFAQDVQTGLSQNPKKLSSRYFYDAEGDRLFQQIMAMPSYYLTGSEMAIFQQQKSAILEAFGRNPFHLIELGAGDGTKTKVLLRYFQEQGIPFNYCPIDISKNVLLELENMLQSEVPGLSVKSQHGDYFKVLGDLKKQSKYRNIVLFLGSNIGNFFPAEANHFLLLLRENLNPGDLVLIGFDLKKNPQTILDAYNDETGITAAFNLNLIARINRELDADFKLHQFKHWESYNPVTGEARSFLVSTMPQKVNIQSLQTTFHFQAWEAIEVELSKKYSLHEIESLAVQNGFQVKQHFFDPKAYFVDTLWVRI
ncbi:MAG TPA: L-histidine N(alpha)-methyltransferase [Saprospiraceae bacterium]|nr:L-histidine N(alpha)-methyltransferase [Saprospiraceae bacterium]HMQ85757.1 L-histidine N(alpha)-methyltransferase [Saprospiraceae bacterium]